ncbi:MAG TPA: hypothetical protein VM166_08370 [Gemmatimonadaceae bacterium]|nr:hypothetical protein [Gemmatimonadaceae bacterium]
MGKAFAVLFLSVLVVSAAIAVSPRWNMPLVARTLYVGAREASDYARVASQYAREVLAERNAEERRRAAKAARAAREGKREKPLPTPEPTPTRVSVPTYDEIPRIETRAVRPGSTTALRARRIDATIHPPLVRAKEAVAALPSRIPSPTPPFLIGLLGCSVIVLAFAVGGVGPQRLAVGLAPLLLLGLTSFHPVTEVPGKRIAAPRDVLHRGRSWADRREQTPVYEQIVQAPMEIAPQPEVPSDDQLIVVPMPSEQMEMDEMQRRMTERMREWDYRRQIIAQQRVERARARQEALERRLHEQICEIAREQGLDCSQ